MFEQRMRAQSYATWQTMLNEACVRALTVLFLRERKGAAAGAAAARAELRAGFPYIEELVEVLHRFRRERARHPRFESYLPEVIGFFDQLAKRYTAAPPKPAFLGPFDAVLAGDYVLALPADGALASYARKLPFFAKVPIVDPAAALAAPPGKGIVAYGTPATNPVIARVADLARWKITAGGIELGAKKLSGEHLVLIATWFRRDDPARGIAVYAAASEADLVGINNLRHGPNDWLVARATPKGFEVVEAGDWPIEDGAWAPIPPLPRPPPRGP
jgi:hypothetical protein